MKFSYLGIFKYFEQYGGYKVTKLNDKEFNVDVDCDLEHITLNVTAELTERSRQNIDVCLVDDHWFTQTGSRDTLCMLLLQIGVGDLKEFDGISSTIRSRAPLIDSWYKYMVSVCKKIHQAVPIILAGDPEWDYVLRDGLTKLKLRQWTPLNRLRRNELANEVGAIKFIRYSVKSGRGFKNLIDEIVCCGLEKLKKENELNAEPECCKECILL